MRGNYIVRGNYRVQGNCSHKRSRELFAGLLRDSTEHVQTASNKSERKLGTMPIQLGNRIRGVRGELQCVRKG